MDKIVLRAKKTTQDEVSHLVFHYQHETEAMNEIQSLLGISSMADLHIEQLEGYERILASTDDTDYEFLIIPSENLSNVYH